MESLNDLPVLILTYNRFDKFKKCLNTIINQGIRRVFISIDGPKNEFDILNQKKIIKYCSKNQINVNFKINQLKKNYGCRNGPLKGITWFFKQNEYGVVLEDDVIISQKCIETFSFLLIKYLDSKKYMSISSFNEYTNKNVENIYSFPVWRSWGWASWANKWEYHIQFSKKIMDLNMWEIYKLLPKNYKSINTAKLVKACQLDLLDAWDYEFNFTHVVNKKSSLTIGGINTLVYGFDKSATHTINLESIGIDFQLFCERKLNIYKLKQISSINKVLVLKKCGFFYQDNSQKYFHVLNFLGYFYHSLIFRLRIIKRIIYKRLKIKHA